MKFDGNRRTHPWPEFMPASLAPWQCSPQSCEESFTAREPKRLFGRRAGGSLVLRRLAGPWAGSPSERSKSRSLAAWRLNWPLKPMHRSRAVNRPVGQAFEPDDCEGERLRGHQAGKPDLLKTTRGLSRCPLGRHRDGPLPDSTSRRAPGVSLRCRQNPEAYVSGSPVPLELLTSLP
jgi:hypothetical protein